MEYCSHHVLPTPYPPTKNGNKRLKNCQNISRSTLMTSHILLCRVAFLYPTRLSRPCPYTGRETIPSYPARSVRSLVIHQPSHFQREKV